MTCEMSAITNERMKLKVRDFSLKRQWENIHPMKQHQKWRTEFMIKISIICRESCVYTEHLHRDKGLHAMVSQQRVDPLKSMVFVDFQSFPINPLEVGLTVGSKNRK